MNEILTYTLPDLGYISVPLRDESRQVLSFLRSALRRGIQYFERLDHLGMLREVHKTGHHPRWEHIVLQCYLFHRASQDNRGLSLKTRVTLSEGAEVSSVEEFLKCWVFLLNFGHLYGTFEAERFWMDLFLRDNDLRARLMDGLPDERSRTLATEMFESQNYYRLHQFFTLFLLARHQNEVRFRNLPIQTWILMVQDYMQQQPDGSTLGRAKDVFHVIRRCSYVYLDVTYSPSPIRIQPAVLLQELRNISLGDFRDPDSTFNRLLRSINDVLFESIYASTASIAFKQHYFDAQQQRYERLVSKQGVHHFTKNIKTLFDRLKEKRESDFGKAPDKIEYEPYLRIRLLPEEFWGRNPVRYFTETQSLNAHAYAAYRFFVTPIPYANLEGSVLDIVAKKIPVKHADVATMFWTCLRYCIDCYSGWEKMAAPLYRDLIHKPLPSLFLKILGLFLPSNFSPRFRDGSSPEQYHVYLIRKQRDVYTWNRNFRQATVKSDVSPDRKRELHCVRGILGKASPFRGYTLISGSNVIIYDIDGRMVAELDGVVINVRKRGFHLRIYETKRGVSQESKTEASKQLTAKLEVLYMGQRARTVANHCWGLRFAQASVAFWEAELKNQTFELV